MFNLETAVQRWRADLERRSSLSPREVDELEDHLRARFDLELELDAGMAPACAFAIVRHELGQGPALGREFEKARKPTWRRWLMAGWVLFAGSLLLRVELRYGYEPYWLLLRNLSAQEILGALLPILAMLLTLPALLGLRLLRGRGVRWLVTSVGLWSVGNAIYIVASGRLWRTHTFAGLDRIGIPDPPGYVPPYVWAWWLSFVFAAIGLWLRDRQRVRAKVEKSTA